MENKKKLDVVNDVKNDDLLKIKEGIKAKASVISNMLSKRIDPGKWSLKDISFSVNDGQDIVDLVFHSPDAKKGKYLLVDISVPHLQIGQTYTLPTKAKYFQKEQKVALTRIKKAIILVRKGTETLSTRPSRIRCPILEVALRDIIVPERKAPEKKRPEKKVQRKKDSVSPELLNALKSAVINETLSTMNKRKNKYIRRGLWKWIEQEIMDPSVHFFLVILSGIYQGRTGDVLSKKFKDIEAFSKSPDDVVEALFSRDNNLADEIKKNSERHKKALKKFLACFSQTPPFEYLRSVFLKEFRSGGDSLKARTAVFLTLKQLLERCGFEGEKEVNYPLEILDELAIFQGILAGDYTTLRVDNATKKLKRLVPQFDWDEDAVYLLRSQLAKSLKLPVQEFNLNAFLPQAFAHDAKYLTDMKGDAGRNSRHNTRSNNEKDVNKRDRQQHSSDDRSRPNDKRLRNEEVNSKSFDKHNRNDRADSNENKQDSVQKTDKRPSRDSSANKERRDARYSLYDEGIHRFFENFGGHLEEDVDAIRLALAMDRYEQERLVRLAAKQAIKKPVENEWENDADIVPPKKSAIPQVVADLPPPLKKRPSPKGRGRNTSRNSSSTSSRNSGSSRGSSSSRNSSSSRSSAPTRSSSSSRNSAPPKKTTSSRAPQRRPRKQRED